MPLRIWDIKHFNANFVCFTYHWYIQWCRECKRWCNWYHFHIQQYIPNELLHTFQYKSGLIQGHWKFFVCSVPKIDFSKLTGIELGDQSHQGSAVRCLAQLVRNLDKTQSLKVVSISEISFSDEISSDFRIFSTSTDVNFPWSFFEILITINALRK